MTPRSYLFVPGDRPERFDKAAAAGAHAIILDLEDAVAPDRKDAARDAVAAWLDARGEVAGPQILVRINTEDTAWFARDCAIVGSAAVHAVMMPKSQDTDVLKALASHLRADQLIVPLIETVKGWDIARALASQAKVQRLAFGSVDFNADAGTSGDGDALDLVRSQLVMASRLADVLPPVDGVSLALEKGEILGVVGESGAGKSTIGNAVIGLLEAPGRLAGGSVLLNGERIDTLTPAQKRKVRGRRIGMKRLYERPGVSSPGDRVEFAGSAEFDDACCQRPRVGEEGLGRPHLDQRRREAGGVCQDRRDEGVRFVVALEVRRPGRLGGCKVEDRIGRRRVG